MNIKAIESAENEIKRLEKINGELVRVCKNMLSFLEEISDNGEGVICNGIKQLEQAIAHAEPVTNIRD